MNRFQYISPGDTDNDQFPQFVTCLTLSIGISLSFNVHCGHCFVFTVYLLSSLICRPTFSINCMVVNDKIIIQETHRLCFQINTIKNCHNYFVNPFKCHVQVCVSKTY